jgi:hypothetical protein
MPERFLPLQGSSVGEILPQLNRSLSMLDQETNSKMYGSSTTGKVIVGKLPNDKFGLLIYDKDGTPRILIGQAPDDGRAGAWVSKPGQSVITLLGG